MNILSNIFIEKKYILFYHERMSKADFLKELMEDEAVLIHVNALNLNVEVPEDVRTDRLVLRFGYNLSPKIESLEINKYCLSGVLSFSGKNFHCIFPWEYVYAIFGEFSKKGNVWEKDVPNSVVEAFGTSNVQILKSDLSKCLEQAYETLNKWRSGQMKLADAHQQTFLHMVNAERRFQKILNEQEKQKKNINTEAIKLIDTKTPFLKIVK